MNYDKSCQILLLGNMNVGKTCLITRYVNGIFKGEYIGTVGLEVNSKNEIINDTNVLVKLWDTAGQERFRALTPSYLRNAEGVMLIYDITSSESFEDLKSWLDSLKTHFGEKNLIIPIVIVGNKIDLEDMREIQKNNAIKFANEYNYKYFEVSAKTGEGVDDAVRELVKQILANKEHYIEEGGEKKSISIQNNKGSNQKKKGCC